MPRVKVRHRHWRRTHRRFAVYLSVMARRNLRLIAPEPDAAHWEARVAAPLGDSRFLQQRQRSAAGANEDKLRANLALVSSRFIADFEDPLSAVAFHILHAARKVNREAVFAAQRIQQNARQRFATFPKESAILCSANETEMRHGVKERLRILDCALFHQIRPELAR